MKTTDKFSCNRLWAVTKRNLVMDWKANLAFFLEVTGILLVGLVIIMLSGWVSTLHHGSRFIPVADTFYSWFSFVTVVGFLIQASQLLHPIARKSGSIDMLMLPASNAEKFVSRVLFATVGYTVMTLAALEVVSLLYYPLAWIFSGDYGSLSLYALKTTFVNDNIHTEVVYNGQMLVNSSFFAVGWWLWIHSSFVLGSALWRRFPFVKMLFAVLLFSFVMGLVIAWMWRPGTVTYIEETISTVYLILSGVMCVFAVANWAVSYWLFTRKQVVEIKRH